MSSLPKFTPPMLLLDYPESTFQDMVIEMAQYMGYATYHETDSRKSARGFPDLTLVGNGSFRQVVYLELKREDPKKGKLSVEQVNWLQTLRLAGVHAYCVRPSQLDLLDDVLRGLIPTPSLPDGIVDERLAALLEAEKSPAAPRPTRRQKARRSRYDR